MTTISEDRDRSANVFIADTSNMGCQLMSAALRRSRNRINVAGSATSAEGVLEAFRQSQAGIGVIVIASDLGDGALSGLKTAAEIRASYPATRIVALLYSSERDVVVEAFRSGATGILSREQPFDILCKCINAVYAGQVWASSKEVSYALEALTQTKETITRMKQDKSLKDRTLTAREEAIVQLIAEGLTNRDVSQELKLSENTVRNYLFRIFNKLGTSNRLELALYAINRKRTADEEHAKKLGLQRQFGQQERRLNQE